MIINSEVTELLASAGIAFDVVEIPLSEDKKPIRNLEELLSEKGLDPTSVVRSVVFRGGSKQFYLLSTLKSASYAWLSMMRCLRLQAM